MSKTEAIKKARNAASSPEARAKAVATLKRRREEKALLAHAKLQEQGIPLDMIPGVKPPKKWTKQVKVKPAQDMRQEVVLALLKYLNGG